MADLGRNDPCKCGSGLKYKKCCLNMAAQPKFSLPWHTYPEDYVLKNLLVGSREFSDYYQSQRSKVTRPILWAHDPSLRAGFTCLRFSTGEQVIAFRDLPPAAAHAAKVAHEIERLVLYAEGFPGIASAPRDGSVCGSLSALLHDPLVDSRLKEFGFDTKEKYLNKFAGSKAELEKATAAPTDRAGKASYTFHFASHVLGGAIFTADTEEYASFLSYFERRFPDLAKAGYELCEVVRSHGYETPDRMLRCFNEIIGMHGLEDILKAS